jgi:hypothetical protein
MPATAHTHTGAFRSANIRQTTQRFRENTDLSSFIGGEVTSADLPLFQIFPKIGRAALMRS